MSVKVIPDGVWPTMITPYNSKNEIDYGTLELLIEWYISQGVAGLFAVCQSSEMFYLGIEERVELAEACVRFAGGRVPVIASGHTAELPRIQEEEVKMIAETGVDAVVLVSNRFTSQEEEGEAFKINLEKFLSNIPDSIRLGFYECPYPYKKILSEEEIKFCVDTGRFAFLKDTSCSTESIRVKLGVMKGSAMKLFNANTATLLESLQDGASGYSGVMANFHPDLYVWLCDHWEDGSVHVKELQDYLTVASLVERQCYPVNAMYYLSREGLPVHCLSRKVTPSDFTGAMMKEIDSFWNLSHTWSDRFRKL